MSNDIINETKKDNSWIMIVIEKKIVYVHSDDGVYHALYRDGKLICWNKGQTDIPAILQGLGISYYDYQISDSVCVPGCNQEAWSPPQSLSYLHFINKAERRNEYKRQRETDDSVRPADFEKIELITV